MKYLTYVMELLYQYNLHKSIIYLHNYNLALFFVLNVNFL